MWIEPAVLQIIHEFVEWEVVNMKHGRRCRKLWMMIVGVICCTLLMSVFAYAKDYKEKQIIYLNGKKSAFTFYDEENSKEVVRKVLNASIYSLAAAEYKDVRVVKNTDPKNVRVTIYKSDGSVSTDGKDGYCMIFSFLKPTKAIVKYTAKDSTGKPVSHTITFIALKYANPFKVLRVGSKGFASAFNKDSYSEGKIRKGVSGKLKIKLKKGWKIKEISYCASDASSIKKVKSTAAIAFKNKTGFLSIELKNTKYGFTQTFFLS